MLKNDEQMKTQTVEKEANYPLFIGLEDKELQANNRGAVIANIFEDFGNGKGKTSRKGLAATLTYLSAIPTEEERKYAVTFVDAHLKARGLK